MFMIGGLSTDTTACKLTHSSMQNEELDYCLGLYQRFLTIFTHSKSA